MQVQMTKDAALRVNCSTCDKALRGDSNDAEHDTLVEIYHLARDTVSQRGNKLSQPLPFQDYAKMGKKKF